MATIQMTQTIQTILWQPQVSQVSANKGASTLTACNHAHGPSIHSLSISFTFTDTTLKEAEGKDTTIQAEGGLLVSVDPNSSALIKPLEQSTPQRRKQTEECPPRRRKQTEECPPRRRKQTEECPPRRRKQTEEFPPRRRKKCPPRRRKKIEECPKQTCNIAGYRRHTVHWVT